MYLEAFLYTVSQKYIQPTVYEIACKNFKRYCDIFLQEESLGVIQAITSHFQEGKKGKTLKFASSNIESLTCSTISCELQVVVAGSLWGQKVFEVGI